MSFLKKNRSNSSNMMHIIDHVNEDSRINLLIALKSRKLQNSYSKLKPNQRLQYIENLKYKKNQLNEENTQFKQKYDQSKQFFKSNSSINFIEKQKNDSNSSEEKISKYQNMFKPSLILTKNCKRNFNFEESKQNQYEKEISYLTKVNDLINQNFENHQGRILSIKQEIIPENKITFDKIYINFDKDLSRNRKISKSINKSISHQTLHYLHTKQQKEILSQAEIHDKIVKNRINEICSNKSIKFDLEETSVFTNKSKNKSFSGKLDKISSLKTKSNPQLNFSIAIPKTKTSCIMMKELNLKPILKIPKISIKLDQMVTNEKSIINFEILIEKLTNAHDVNTKKNIVEDYLVNTLKFGKSVVEEYMRSNIDEYDIIKLLVQLGNKLKKHDLCNNFSKINIFDSQSLLLEKDKINMVEKNISKKAYDLVNSISQFHIDDI